MTQTKTKPVVRLAWRDITPYSRFETLRVPRIWKAGFSTGLSLHVHRHEKFPADQWLMTANGLFHNHELVAKDIDAAKQEAEGLYLAMLRQTLKELV